MSKSVFRPNSTRNLMYMVLGAAIIFLIISVYLYFFSNVRTEIHKPIITENFNINIENDSIVDFNKKITLVEVDSSYLASIISLKKELNNEFIGIKAKLDSVDTRFSDLYTLGSIILGLIVAILAGAVISGRTSVRNYLEDNEKDIKENLEKHLKYASKMVGDIEVELKIANEFKTAQQYKGKDSNSDQYTPKTEQDVSDDSGDSEEQ